MTSFPEYQRLRGVNWSTLRHMHTSPLEYRDRLLNPRNPTPAMVLGSAIHTAVLEPELFEATYTYYDGAHTGYEWESVKAGAEAAGMSLLSTDQWEQCMGAAWAVHCGRQGREARRLLRGAHTEVTLQWVDPDTHVRCKARPDIVSYTRETDGTIGPWVLADVKTTTTVDPRKFGRLAGDMVYHGKMAFAAMGLEAIYGRAPVRVSIIAVEQSPPHDVAVFDIDDGAMASSREMVLDLLQTLQRCRRRRSWPGRCENTQVLDLAPWLFEDQLTD